MVKNLLKPFQEVLLKKRMCVACTYPLDKATRIGQYDNNRMVVQCKCRRRYLFSAPLDSYKRMTLQEEQIYLNKNRQA